MVPAAPEDEPERTGIRDGQYWDPGYGGEHDDSILDFVKGSPWAVRGQGDIPSIAHDPHEIEHSLLSSPGT